MRGNSSKGKSSRKTKAQLNEENNSLRRRVRELEQGHQGLGKGKRPDQLSEAVQRIYKEVPIGLCHLDTDLRYWHINDWLAALNGLSVEDHLGRSIGEVLPHVAADVEAQLRQVIETGKPILGGTVDAETPAQPGVTRSFQHSYFPVRSDDGAVVGVSCVVEDITERKKLDRMKSEFISTVSHELRTPLTSIKGSLGLVVNGTLGALPEEAKDMVDIAHNNTDRLINLVNDILEMETLDSGKLEFDIQPLDLSSLVTEAVATNKGYAKEYGVKFVLADLAPEVMVRGDGNRLTQVVTNLLSNAAKFSPKGGKVEISVASHDGMARVSVSDHGSGIPEEYREHIFERFIHVDSSDTRQVGGTGLGLSITKSIVEKHGGAIGFDSEVGVGSTFFFTLPV